MAHDNICSHPKLITFGHFQVELYHPGIGVGVHCDIPHAKCVAGLNDEGESSSSSPNQKKPNVADAETAQRASFSGLADVASEWCIASSM